MPTPMIPPIESPPPAHPPIPRGWATKLGSVLAILTLIVVPAIGTLASTAAPLHVPSRFWVTVGMALSLAVILGRMLQAAVAIWHSPLPPASDDTEFTPLRLVQ